MADEKSEEIAEVFLSGQMDIDAFLNSYTASRTVSEPCIYQSQKHEQLLHEIILSFRKVIFAKQKKKFSINNFKSFKDWDTKIFLEFMTYAFSLQ
jgi:23S rRNA C2498 (ribose-2'-O)-methylase RlmM